MNAPAYVELGQESIASKLGFSDSSQESTSKQLYEIWMISPENNSFTPTQLSKIHEYRYINDLMMPPEIIEYENSLIQSPQKA